MSLRAHRKLTAWLGLLAIWLGLLMPIASQSVQRHQGSALNLTFCLAGDSQHAQVPATGDSDHQASHDGWQACGYCGLLAQHMPVPHVVALAADAGGRHGIIPTAIYVAIDLPPAHTPAFPRAPPLLIS